jgi:murein DD-endopeptidase MepM/ murein hydrolase activator NlpD
MGVPRGKRGPSEVIVKIGSLLLLVPLGVAQAAAPSASAIEEGRALTRSLYKSDVDGIWTRLSPATQAALRSPDNLLKFLQKIQKDQGRETRVLEEKSDAVAGTKRYLRIATFEKGNEPMEVPWNFDAFGRVTTLGIRKPATEAASPHLSYKTKTALRLPFDGEWTVWWGGRTVWENFHAVTPDQRFACDFVIVKDGRPFAAQGAKNEDYFAFGQPVLAPAAGKIVLAVDGLEDGTPGSFDNNAEPFGNRVVIEHGNGEWSLLGHLKKGSAKVKAGALVKAGDRIAQVGNSGRSLEPNLHYHLQDAAEVGSAKGLPAAFRDYMTDGKPVAQGEPVRGQRIKPGA